MNADAFWKRLRLHKPQPHRSKTYLIWLHQWPCIVCGKYPESAHSGEHGLGTKASDFKALPVCADHHRGPQGLDTLGPEEFERVYNVDIKALVLTLIEVYLAEGNQL